MNSEPKPRMPNGKWAPEPSKRMTFKELYDQKVIKEKSPHAIRDIAAELGVSTQAVYKMMRRMGLRSPGRRRKGGRPPKTGWKDGTTA